MTPSKFASLSELKLITRSYKILCQGYQFIIEQNRINVNETHVIVKDCYHLNDHKLLTNIPIKITTSDENVNLEKLIFDRSLITDMNNMDASMMDLAVRYKKRMDIVKDGLKHLEYLDK